MNLSAPFVRRPVATVLLTVGVALAGIAAFFVLPVAPLPQVDFPVISVSGRIPGASPETMATSVATPLERRLGSIAGVNEITSQSSTGSTRVTLQFDLDRDIDGAAREVQAAINASRADLPATLRSNPTYRKANPAAAPVIILALTSKTKTPGQIYDAVSNIVSQRLSQVDGVGDVEIGGGSLPAVRVELLPFALNHYGISTEDVRAAIQASNANRPKGALQGSGRRLQIYTQTPALRAADYASMVVAWRNGSAVRLADVAEVVDGVEDTRTLGLFNGEPAVVVLITRQPSANIIETVDGVRALLPELQADLPPDVTLNVASDSTNSIRSSLREVEFTLVVSVVLVVLVVGLFLRNLRAALVPAVATVVALLGTFGVMHLLGFSLNNLSLMALTVATGFVVDDAIVVLENTSRHLEEMRRGAPGPEGTAAGISTQAHVGEADGEDAPVPSSSQNTSRHLEEMRRGAPGPEGTAAGVSTQAHVGEANVEDAPAPGRSQNTSRHIEAGMARLEAALLGAREVGFTVLSISVSLIAVFIPLLFMGGQQGRLFREFAITLSAAVMISLVISLTTTPMMCAWLLDPGGAGARPPGRLARRLHLPALARAAERGYGWVLARYEASLDWALASKALVMLILAAVVGLNVYLYAAAPKGFFPQQDSGQLNGGLRADQSISSQALGDKLRQVVDIVHRDPAVDTVVGFVGGGRAGGGFMFVNLKKPDRRGPPGPTTASSAPPGGASGAGDSGSPVSGQGVIARLRPQLAQVTGLSVFLNPVQDLRSGGRSTNSTYQYTLKSDNLADLRTWAQKLADELKRSPTLTDVDTDQQENGVETVAQVDTASARRLGLSAGAIDAALYNAFGQRQVATIYTELNQYHVIMEWAPRYTRSPNALDDVYVAATRTVQSGGVAVATETTAGTGGTNGTTGTSTTTDASDAGGGAGTGIGAGTGTSSTSSAAVTPPAVSANPGLKNASTGNVLANTPTALVPLSAVARFVENSTATSVNHQDAELATTVSFNLAAGATLADARAAIAQAEADIAMPTTVRGAFAGTALSAQQSQGQQGLLILAALVVIYIVLGMLYESLIHPITVLSTLPSAGVGAVLALLMFRMDFSLIALIGVFLLIGIVKKNAILIIDFALEAERSRGLSSVEAVREACLLRFRPILMTTLAAALGALPLAIGFGEGAELRQPLGVAIIGGLIASQLLTLLTTPVVYILLDRLRRRAPDERPSSRAGDEAAAARSPS